MSYFIRATNIYSQSNLSSDERKEKILELMEEADLIPTQVKTETQIVYRESDHTIKEQSWFKARIAELERENRAYQTELGVGKELVKELYTELKDERSVDLNNITPDMMAAVMCPPEKWLKRLEGNLMDVMVNTMSDYLPEIHKLNRPSQMSAILHLGFSEVNFLEALAAKSEDDLRANMKGREYKVIGRRHDWFRKMEHDKKAQELGLFYTLEEKDNMISFSLTPPTHVAKALYADPAPKLFCKGKMVNPLLYAIKKRRHDKNK